MFGGMHRLHEISDKEKLYNRLVRGLRNDHCKVDNIKVEHDRGCTPLLSCELTMPYRDYSEDAVDSLSYAYHDWKSVNEMWSRMDLMRKRDGEKIKKVIFSGPVTTVIWNDGTKTNVRCEGEDFDHEKGLAMAIAKKYLGTNKNRSNYYDEFKKWIPKNEKETEKTITVTETLYTNGLPFLEAKFDKEIEEMNKMVSERISNLCKIAKENIEDKKGE